MGKKYEPYYGENKHTMLFKEDIVAQSPEELKTIKQMGGAAEPCLKYVDEWESVPPEVIRNAAGGNRPGLNNTLQLARNGANGFIGVLNGMKDVDLARKGIAPLSSAKEQLVNACKNLHGWDHVVLPFILSEKLDGAQKFVELVATINSFLVSVRDRVEELGKAVTDGAGNAKQKVTEAIKESSDKIASAVSRAEASLTKHLDDTKAKFEGILAECGTYQERMKKLFEESETFVQNEAMTAFGKAFDLEATLADRKAMWAGVFSVVSLVLTGVIIGVFLHLEMNGTIRYDKAAEVAHWTFLRFSVLGILIWIAGHFFRERRNFLHVAVANRHRRNLCNAYIAIAEKMTEEGRSQYLANILPQLSRLGKTGFITKEEIPDTPLGQAYKVVSDAVNTGPKT